MSADRTEALQVGCGKAQAKAVQEPGALGGRCSGGAGPGWVGRVPGAPHRMVPCATGKGQRSLSRGTRRSDFFIGSFGCFGGGVGSLQLRWAGLLSSSRDFSLWLLLQTNGLVALRHVGSSRAWDGTHVPCIGRWILTH